MPNAIWSGSISFGLVSIPVKLFPAISQRTIRFNQIDTRTGSRVRQRLVSAADGTEVPREAIRKGYEKPSGDYVLLDGDDMAALSPKKSTTISIEQFIDLSEIDPLIYNSAYNVLPDKTALKPYALLMRAMEESDRVAIGRFVMRTKEHLAAIRPDGDRLVLSTLVYADELNDPAEQGPVADLDEVEISDKELQTAGQLIGSLTEPFDHTSFVDSYREQVMALIEERDQVPVTEGEPGGGRDAEIVDLMQALEASVREARDTRTRHPTSTDTPPAKATKAKKAPAKKKAAAKKAPAGAEGAPEPRPAKRRAASRAS